MMTGPCSFSVGKDQFLAEPIIPVHLISISGQTKKESTTTEAESYMRLAQANNLLPTDYEGYLRATSENYALDSFQNLLFSIARFHEYTGRYPTKITVVGYEMKRKRFTELHRAALRWPEHKFEYIGIDAEGEDSEIAREGEVCIVWIATQTLSLTLNIIL